MVSEVFVLTTRQLLSMQYSTVIACQRPPRAVATPRAFKASAMARSDLALTDDLEALRRGETRKGLALCLQAEAERPA